jgi:cytochrome c556
MTKSRRRLVLVVVAAVATVALGLNALAADTTTTDREFIEMQTSLNAVMVAVVDWSAHEVWEAGYAETMTGRNWLTVKQYATELLAAGTLVSLGGTGKSDMAWVNSPEWQEWTARMIADTEEALRAIEARDQAALMAAGEALVITCEGCHEAFKPGIPTEGIMHVPHHEYGDPLARD